MVACDIRLAEQTDDVALRELLRSRPMEGDIKLSLEREPDFFGAARVEGDKHATVIACENGSGCVIGMGSRSVSTAFVNGEPRRLGYLSQMRARRGEAHRLRSVADCYRLLGEQRHADELPWDVTTVLADNMPAIRFLTRGLRGLPVYREVGRMVTFSFSPRSMARSAYNCDADVRSGSHALLDDIAACSQRNAARFQFAPFWSGDDLRSDIRTPGLRPEDFLVAFRKGRMVGCLAVWDQRAFRQIVVRGYSRRLAVARSVANIAAWFVGSPRLPRAGTALSLAYLSHLAIDEDDPAVFHALVSEASARAKRRGLELLSIGLPSSSLLANHARQRARVLETESIVYCAMQQGGCDPVLDGRLPYVEVATQ